MHLALIFDPLPLPLALLTSFLEERLLLSSPMNSFPRAALKRRKIWFLLSFFFLLQRKIFLEEYTRKWKGKKGGRHACTRKVRTRVKGSLYARGEGSCRSLTLSLAFSLSHTHARALSFSLFLSSTSLSLSLSP